MEKQKDYQYYYAMKKRQESYTKIKNIDEIVFFIFMTPIVLFFIVFNALAKLS